MTTPLIAQVEVHADAFHREAAILAFRGFRQVGFGIVVAKFGLADPNDDTIVRAALHYQPFDPDDPTSNSDLLELINSYDPYSQYVLVVNLEHGGTFCGIVPKEIIGTTPREAFIQETKRTMPIEPGAVIKLKQSVGDVQAGYYVFVRQQRAMMMFAQAEMDDEGDVVIGEHRVELHMDFRDWLDPTGIVVMVDEG